MCQGEFEPAGRAAGANGAICEQPGGLGGREDGRIPRGKTTLRGSAVPGSAEVGFIRCSSRSLGKLKFPNGILQITKGKINIAITNKKLINIVNNYEEQN